MTMPLSGGGAFPDRGVFGIPGWLLQQETRHFPLFESQSASISLSPFIRQGKIPKKLESAIFYRGQIVIKPSHGRIIS